MTSNFKPVSRIPIVVGLAALGLFDAAFYWFMVRPLDDREQETAAAIAAVERQVEQRRETVERLRSVVEKIEAARSTGDRLIEDITVRRRTAFSTLVIALDRAASEAQIEDRDRTYDIEPVEGANEYGIVRMNANFRGRYENIVRFLNLIDRSEQFFIIESLGASPQTDAGELQVSMRVDTFVRDL